MRLSTHWLERDSILASILTLPAAIWMVTIVGFPIFLVFWISFHRQATIETGRFVGFDNYLFILSRPDFWESAMRTAIWTTGNIILILPLGVLTALLLNSSFIGQRFFRSWALLPWMFPIVVTVLLWQWILNPVAGVMNYILLQLGIINSPISFFESATSAMVVVILVNVWRWTPFMAVVALAALQTIPKEYYEAARIDGASGPKLFWHITLPLIWPTLTNTVFILLIWLFNMFPTIWLMTRGGPGDATTTLPIHIYKQGMEQFRMSEAATISVLLLILFVLPLAAWYFRRMGTRLRD